MPAKKELLREVPLFRGLDDALIEEILARLVERTFLKGQTVFVEGERPRGLLVVWRGRLKVYKSGDGGREQILEVPGPGSSVAELPLLDGGSYPASCAALEDSIVLTMSRSTFHRLLDREPALTRAILGSLARRLRHMVDLIEGVSLKAVRERLGGLLLELAGERESFELASSHQELAARIGTVREIVSRTLSRMARDGAITIDGRKVTILDRGLL